MDINSPGWAQSIVRDVCGQTPKEMLEKGYTTILEPNKGDVVYFHDIRGDRSIRAVKIASGNFLTRLMGGFLIFGTGMKLAMTGLCWKKPIAGMAISTSSGVV